MAGGVAVDPAVGSSAHLDLFPENVDGVDPVLLTPSHPPVDPASATNIDGGPEPRTPHHRDAYAQGDRPPPHDDYRLRGDRRSSPMSRRRRAFADFKRAVRKDALRACATRRARSTRSKAPSRSTSSRSEPRRRCSRPPSRPWCQLLASSAHARRASLGMDRSLDWTGTCGHAGPPGPEVALKSSNFRRRTRQAVQRKR